MFCNTFNLNSLSLLSVKNSVFSLFSWNSDTFSLTTVIFLLISIFFNSKVSVLNYSALPLLIFFQFTKPKLNNSKFIFSHWRPSNKAELKPPILIYLKPWLSPHLELSKFHHHRHHITDTNFTIILCKATRVGWTMANLELNCFN